MEKEATDEKNEHFFFSSSHMIYIDDVEDGVIFVTHIFLGDQDPQGIIFFKFYRVRGGVGERIFLLVVAEDGVFDNRGMDSFVK